MKKITFLSLISLQSIAMLCAQEVKTKPDTMSVILNGEHITLPVPKDGNKTTINLEDSASIIQISVSKTSKSKLASNSPVALRKSSPAPEMPARRISWFNEVDFGIMALVGRKTYKVNDTGYAFDFSFNSLNANPSDRATVVKYTPKIINPGFSFGFTIREKRRPIRKSDYFFITGTRFRYSRFTTKGLYEEKEIKAVTKNGVTTYYPDSVYLSRSGEYKSATSSYNLLFPFLVERQFKSDGSMKIAAGLNLVLNIHGSKYSENIGNTSANIFYTNPQVIQLQPVVRASYKKTSLYLSYTISKTKIGYGFTESVSGNMLYFGAAYKLY